jgi:hypothetical protein
MTHSCHECFRKKRFIIVPSLLLLYLVCDLYFLKTFSLHFHITGLCFKSLLCTSATWLLSLVLWTVYALFAWLISHQPTVLFSHNKPATSNQPAVLFSQNKPAPAISHQPTEQADNLRPTCAEATDVANAVLDG